MQGVVTAPTIHTMSAAAPKARAPSPPVDTVNAVAATVPTPIAILQMLYHQQCEWLTFCLRHSMNSLCIVHGEIDYNCMRKTVTYNYRNTLPPMHPFQSNAV